ncbi:DUF2059 domain-containing protein [Synechococcus sp. PCC 7335]|uniref:DUF2059 domain-containing protein n=1 Tax=Synechococcus sp. (strain ATCC 29403 / PCC 7335) TaxID=91464 RepID=UPI000315F612|nr:DUF2059 domain-containing protein [Synechococcus sp. PCC 7335]
MKFSPPPTTAISAALSCLLAPFLSAAPSIASELDTGSRALAAIELAQTTDILETEVVEAEASSDQISVEMVTAIEELLEITDTGALTFQIVETTIDQFRQLMPDIPEEWWDRFIDKFDYEELNQLIVPIYARHFTLTEINAIIDFYRTPVGQAVIEKMPLVVQDSSLVGQRWGMGIAQEIIDELESEGYTPPSEAPFVL